MPHTFTCLALAFTIFAAAGSGAESRLSPASSVATTPQLQRPTSGSGSVRLTNVAVRQESRTYKVLPQGELKLHFFFPPSSLPSDRRPAMIFFHGYSSKDGGSADVMFSQAEYFAARGLVTASVD
jgi:hypothetical protein